jgi:DNA polymerase III delta prime subunit
MSTGTTFGEVLRHLRKRAGLTQGDLAAAAGCSVSYISALETGQRRPDAGWCARSLRPPWPPRAMRACSTACRNWRLLRPQPSIRRRGPPPRMPPPGTLLGRDADIAALGQRLLRHPGRLLTLTGPPGIGKTSLALAVARDLAHTQANGVCVVWLGAVSRQRAGCRGNRHVRWASSRTNGRPHARLIAHLRNRRTAAPPRQLRACDAGRRRSSQTCCRPVRTAAHSRHLPRPAAAACRAKHPGGASRRRRRAWHYSSPACAQPGCRLHSAVARAAACGRRNLPLARPSAAGHRADRRARAGPCRLIHCWRCCTDSRLDLLGGRATGCGASALSPPPCSAAMPSWRRRSSSCCGCLASWTAASGLDAVAWLGGDLRTVQALADKSLVRLESVGDVRRVRLLETVREYARHVAEAAGELEAGAAADGLRGVLLWPNKLRRCCKAPRRRTGCSGWSRNVTILRGAALCRRRRCGRRCRAHRGGAAPFLGGAQPPGRDRAWLAVMQATAAKPPLDARLGCVCSTAKGTIAFYRGEYAAAGAYFPRCAAAAAKATGDRRASPMRWMGWARRRRISASWLVARMYLGYQPGARHRHRRRLAGGHHADEPGRDCTHGGRSRRGSAALRASLMPLQQRRSLLHRRGRDQPGPGLSPPGRAGPGGGGATPGAGRGPAGGERAGGGAGTGETGRRARPARRRDRRALLWPCSNAAPGQRCGGAAGRPGGLCPAGRSATTTLAGVWLCRRCCTENPLAVAGDPRRCGRDFVA